MRWTHQRDHEVTPDDIHNRLDRVTFVHGIREILHGPPALRILVSGDENIDGFRDSGHVSQ
ncbi:MAG: hypothetical protein M8353_02430 [ANME-2 cluster archaeon]|nr:hypothetical protein [ANME-2 cluster archaeon]